MGRETWKRDKKKDAEASLRYYYRNRLKILLKRYNLSEEKYHLMLKNQGFKCAICDETKKLEIDHDHSTGFVRGLLYHKHNKALGLFKDNREILNRAYEYLTDSVIQYRNTI